MDVRLSGLAAGLTAGALLAALAACTSEEPAEPAAREVAQSYVQLIATGSGTELEQLWQATASDRSADIRRAGRILAEAEQRIEVIEVGEAEPVDGSVDVPFDSDLDSGNARQVTVSYQLAGTSYDGHIVLAPHEDLPLEDPQTWAVVEPLMATVERGSNLDEHMDIYIGGIDTLVVGRRSGEYPVLYPGQYEVERRADPYLVSTTGSLRVPAGDPVNLPQLTVHGTDEAASALGEAFTEVVQRCIDREGCARSLDSLLRNQGVESVNGGGWSAELTTAPHVSLAGDRAELTGGVLHLRLSNGSESDVPFEGTANWALNWQDSVPAFGNRLDLWEVDR